MTAVPIENYLEGPYLSGPPGYLAGTFGEVTGMQVEMLVNDREAPQGMQVDMKTDASAPQGMQVKIFPLKHIIHGKYLVDDEPYLTTSYLAEKMCELQGMQVNMQIISAADDHLQGMQVDMKTDGSTPTGMQVEQRIDTSEPLGMQVDQIITKKTGMQANLVLYNTTQLRILCEFPSRGIENQYGSNPISVDNANWFTPQTMASGDLGKLANLNTDVLEQRIQSGVGVSVLDLRTDTGLANTFVDTLAILEHNITTSATITVQGSDDQNFNVVKFSFTVNPTDPYAIFIAPTLPTIAARFYKVLISDPTNPDGNIKIGTIIFGTSKIFSPKECFDNGLIFGKRHFKDEIKTEGFTNNSNDRATRRILSLTFSDLDVEGPNYDLIQDFMDFAKTDLKCLIIPTPSKPTVLTVFSKLTQLPEERHNALDVQDNISNVHFAQLALDWDESD